jgi:hypothetical protein
LPNWIRQSIGKQSKTKPILLKIGYGFYAFSYRFTLRFLAARPLTFFASLTRSAPAARK